MRKNLHHLFNNAEALMLLAEFLHKVLLRRNPWQTNKAMRKEYAKCDKRFEQTFKRLQKIIDYRADSADTLLRCKIKNIVQPHIGETVCIGISSAPRKSVNNKKRIIKNQRTC